MHRQSSLLAVAALVAVLVSTAPVAVASERALEPSRFAPFTGEWYRHGTHLSVSPTGSAEAVWRTYTQCGEPGVTGPCDRGVEPGGYGAYLFLAVDGSTAYGVATASLAPVALTLRPDGTALLVSGEIVKTPPATWRLVDGVRLCPVGETAPRVPIGTCGA